MGRGHLDTGKQADVKARIKIRICKEIKNGDEENKESNEKREENTPSSKQFYPRDISVIPWQVLNCFVDFTYLSKDREFQVGKDKKTYKGQFNIKLKFITVSHKMRLKLNASTSPWKLESERISFTCK